MLSKSFFKWQESFQPQRYILGCSGGIDSMVLLYLLAQNKSRLIAPLTVIYINHGWNTLAENWGIFVKNHCEKLGISFQSVNLKLDKVQANKEAIAREKRYKVFADAVGENGVLFTAHHQNDQAETFLLNLLRGSGLSGLSAMPARKVFAQGEMWRPLLDWSRKDIEAYAQVHQISHIEDPSNKDTNFMRNWLRHEIISNIEKRRPEAISNISKSVVLLQEHRAIEAEMLEFFTQIDDENRLPLACLADKTIALKAAIIRYWLEKQNLKMPPQKQLANWIMQITQNDNHAQLDYADMSLIRFHDLLYALSNKQIAAPPEFRQQSFWQGIGELVVTSGFENLPKEAKWVLPEAGMLFQKKNDLHHKLLNEWFRKHKIPPFLRRIIPLLVQRDSILWAGKLGKSAQCPECEIIWKE